MINLIKSQDMARSLPDEALRQSIRNPSPQMPPFVAAGVLQGRERMRMEFADEAMGNTGGPTVIDDLMKGTMAELDPQMASPRPLPGGPGNNPLPPTGLPDPSSIQMAQAGPGLPQTKTFAMGGPVHSEGDPRLVHGIQARRLNLPSLGIGGIGAGNPERNMVVQQNVPGDNAPISRGPLAALRFDPLGREEEEDLQGYSQGGLVEAIEELNDEAARRRREALAFNIFSNTINTEDNNSQAPAASRVHPKRRGVDEGQPIMDSMVRSNAVDPFINVEDLRAPRGIPRAHRGRVRFADGGRVGLLGISNANRYIQDLMKPNPRDPRYLGLGKDIIRGGSSLLSAPFRGYDYLVDKGVAGIRDLGDYLTAPVGNEVIPPGEQREVPFTPDTRAATVLQMTPTSEDDDLASPFTSEGQYPRPAEKDTTTAAVPVDPVADLYSDPLVREYQRIIADNPRHDSTAVLEKILANREARAASDPKVNRGLAMAAMGAAMAGGKSPHFATNVAAGMQAGINAFQQARALDSANAASVDAATAAIEQARIAASEGRRDDALAALNFHVKLKLAAARNAPDKRDLAAQGADVAKIKEAFGLTDSPEDQMFLRTIMMNVLSQGGGLNVEALRKLLAERQAVG